MFCCVAAHTYNAAIVSQHRGDIETKVEYSDNSVNYESSGESYRPSDGEESDKDRSDDQGNYISEL